MILEVPLCSLQKIGGCLPSAYFTRGVSGHHSFYHTRWSLQILPGPVRPCLAPAALQKIMETVLKGIHEVRNYLDDIIIYTTQESHDEMLHSVM